MPSSSATHDMAGKDFQKPIHQSLTTAACQPPPHLIIYIIFPALATADTKTNPTLEQIIFTHVTGAKPLLLFVFSHIGLIAVSQNAKFDFSGTTFFPQFKLSISEPPFHNIYMFIKS